MARVAGSEREIDVLVNCKTYPAVSKKYIETVCTGGIGRDNTFVRLYPIPFRFLEEKEQYDRWDIIRVKVYKDTKDQRPESWHIEGHSPIEVLEAVKSEKVRWEWMRHGVFTSTDQMLARGLTNGLVEIVPRELYWEREAKTWTKGQLEVITQGNLFHDPKLMQSLAERVPWQLKLRLTEYSTGKEFDQKVLAWSYYQGYRRLLREYPSEEAALKQLQTNIYKSILDPTRKVFAVFGTHSRFGHWMISALYHAPRHICDEVKLF